MTLHNSASGGKVVCVLPGPGAPGPSLLEDSGRLDQGLLDTPYRLDQGLLTSGHPCRLDQGLLDAPYRLDKAQWISSDQGQMATTSLQYHTHGPGTNIRFAPPAQDSSRHVNS